METTPIAERSQKVHFGPLSRAQLSKQVRNLSKARGKILEYLSDGPCTVSSLAVRTGQHKNTIREHLDALVDEGLATRYQMTEHVRGRPAWIYRNAEQTEISEYAGLASALAGAIIRGSRNPVVDAMEAGIAWAPELIRNSQVDSDPKQRSSIAVRRKIVLLLGQLGFAPKHNADLTKTKLTQCPLLDAARQHPNVICNVHLGIVRGALAEFGADAKSVNKADLEPFSEPGACLLRM